MRHLFLISFFIIYGVAASDPIDLANQPQALSEGLYRNVAFPYGMPLGGIGCGSFDLKTDGWFDRLTINNNWRGYLPRPDSSFLAVWIRDEDRISCKTLRHADPVFDSVDRIAFTGIFPHAMLTFADDDLPIDIRLDAWTPLVPWNLKDSTLPGGLFVFRCKNTTERPLEIAIAFAWENLLGEGVDLQTGIPWQDRRGNYQEPRRSRSVSGVIFSTTRTLEPSDPRRSALGTYALAVERQDSHTVTLLPSWNARSPETFMSLFSDDGMLFDEKEPGPWPTGSDIVHPAGAVSDRFVLPPGESCEIPFALAWHCPVVIGPDGTEHHQLSAVYFDDAWDTAAYLLKNRNRLASETEMWRGALLSSTLPPWLKVRLLNDLIPLFSRSVLIDDRFALIDDPYEGTLQSTLAASLTNHLIMAFFPDLVASGLRLVVDGQREGGEILSAPGSVSEIVGGTLSGFDGVRDPKAACALALRFYQYDQMIGDDGFRGEIYPALNRAMRWLAGQDTNQDGIPENIDTAQEPERRRDFSSTANLWLAALHSTRDLASKLNDLQ
ncbi:MAG: GH116 family glycosyl-hydrolase, partial [bacterium]